MNYEEYVVSVIDRDNESYNIKTFANNLKEAIDNIVCMPSIVYILSVDIKEINYSWKPKSKLELDDLREIRKEITNEKELSRVLSNNENN
tara:strand:- start:98 stop:367 length:270 start_codon:yes stop_codon:yes gene_type:complete